uniref:Pre-mRNA-processing factor 19 n=1 Tax=Rhodosorus marinus TaxID=101924 RepID=A0A7S2ZM54_9RHOD|mmetsp:Transcript_21832/g.88911  ORF Transcript_21832/g.88911 Transcript_21832/m.88911 type:complete len:180 (+) Transcript_21832:260-799(+)
MEGFVGVGRFQVGRTDRPGRVCRNKSRMKAGDSSGDGFQFDWDLMQKRISKVRNEEEEREKQYSSNWKSGKAKQEVAAYLKEDYFRRLKLFGPKLISGSHTGSIHMFNLRNAKKEWSAAAHGFEVTALDFNGKYVVSGAVDGTVRLMSSKGEPLKLSSEARHAGRVDSLRIQTLRSSPF